MIRLYYYPSYVSLLPHIVLEEIGLKYELVFVDRYANAHKRPEYLKLNPNGLIPVLCEGDLVLYEARAMEVLTPGLASWLEGGRHRTGDPPSTPD